MPARRAAKSRLGTPVRGPTVEQTVGVLIAIVSSCLGGSAAAVTRYLAGNADPITLAILRWGIGFMLVLPAALVMRAKWPPHRTRRRALSSRPMQVSRWNGVQPRAIRARWSWSIRRTSST